MGRALRAESLFARGARSPRAPRAPDTSMAALVLLSMGHLCACGGPPHAVHLGGLCGQPSPPRDPPPRGAPVLSRPTPQPSLAGARGALCAVVAGGREVYCWGAAAAPR